MYLLYTLIEILDVKNGLERKREKCILKNIQLEFFQDVIHSSPVYSLLNTTLPYHALGGELYDIDDFSVYFHSL